MAVTEEELERFHSFASEQINNGGADLCWDDLFSLWRLLNPPAEEQAEIDASIRRGIAQINAGLGRTAREVMEELRQKHNISSSSE